MGEILEIARFFRSPQRLCVGNRELFKIEGALRGESLYQAVRQKTVNPRSTIAGMGDILPHAGRRFQPW
jgi:hypothetical protein